MDSLDLFEAVSSRRDRASFCCGFGRGRHEEATGASGLEVTVVWMGSG